MVPNSPVRPHDSSGLKPTLPSFYLQLCVQMLSACQAPTITEMEKKPLLSPPHRVALSPAHLPVLQGHQLHGASDPFSFPLVYCEFILVFLWPPNACHTWR